MLGVIRAALTRAIPRACRSRCRITPPRSTGDIKGLKLGLPKEYMIGGLDPEVKAAVDAAVKQFEKLGAEIVEISLPHTDYAVATYYIIATAEASANLARFDGIRYGARVDGADPIELYSKTRGAGFGAEVKRRIILGTYVLSSGYYDAYYLRAQKVRTLIRQRFSEGVRESGRHRHADDADGRVQDRREIRRPACKCICRTSSRSPATSRASAASAFRAASPKIPKLPIGLQLLGKPFGEETILKIAHAYEQKTSTNTAACFAFSTTSSNLISFPFASLSLADTSGTDSRKLRR